MIMKVLLFLVISIFLTLSMKGQTDRNVNIDESGMGKISTPDLIGKPTFESNKNGLEVRIWITPGNTLMNEIGINMDSTGMGMNLGDNTTNSKRDSSTQMWDTINPSYEIKGNSRSVPAESNKATHQVLVELIDTKTNEAISSATISVDALFPSGRHQSFNLLPKTGEFGGKLSLDEKGSYQLGLNISHNGNEMMIPFKYTVD